jgi:hypothetical protein
MALRTINKQALATHDEVRDRRDADVGQEDRWEIRSEQRARGYEASCTLLPCIDSRMMTVTRMVMPGFFRSVYSLHALSSAHES